MSNAILDNLDNLDESVGSVLDSQTFAKLLPGLRSSSVPHSKLASCRKVHGSRIQVLDNEKVRNGEENKGREGNPT